jgi:predicted porin
MKKILLGTTTLIGAAALFAGAAHADAPKVTFGGFADFQVGVTGEDLDTNMRSHGFRSDTTLTFRVDGTADNGLNYGGGIDLNADVTAPAQGSGANAKRTFVYLGGNWGELEMGSEVGAQGTMKVDASNIARATGGIDGDFWFFTSTNTARFLATPDLVLGYGVGNLGNETQENLNKVTYYTPRFSGFQLGVSYTVNSTDRGQVVLRTDNTAGRAENIWSGGISYDNTFGDVGVAIAATGEWGNSEVAATEDLRAWNVGGKLSYEGFSLAGSYGDWGDSLRTATLNADDTDYWTLGGAYEYGPFGASVTYLDSTYDNGTGLGKNDWQNISVGTDYKLAPGLTPYAEINFIKMEAPGTVNDNDATVFIAGTQLSF